VVDTTKPVISLVGDNPQTVECHTAYAELGATATDTCAGDLTSAIVVTGTVNANSPGTYTVTYSATDPNHNTGTATRTVNVVDTTKPVVTLNGPNPMTVECHSSFADPGAGASDTCAGDLTSVVIVTGTVNPNSPGTYSLTYSATDPSHNTGMATRTVNVVDTTAPVVTLKGASPMTVECHSTFIDPGATAADTCAGDLSGSIVASGTVDSNTPGTYTLTYSSTDPSHNMGTATRTVHVVDTAKPSITLKGANPLTVECHSAFSDPGASAADICAGDLTASIIVTGTVNPNAPGSYTLTYSATDPSHNTGTATRTVNVVDTGHPSIALNGSNPMIVYLNGSFVDPGATATDICAGSLPVSVSGSVNVNVVGTYTITYGATDPSGNASTATRTVYVQYQVAGTSCIGNPGHTILQPINADGTSVSKQGSTVPAKFQVFDANCVSIGTPGLVTSFVLAQIKSGTVVNVVNEAPDSTTPDTAFRWDPTGQLWIFNISTKSLSKNNTYVYLITLNDGSTIQFQFGLR
jgi:hypothetical protein